MSRSNPTNNIPHPCSRWFEWDGQEGCPRYYDKQKKENVQLEPDFTFILLDETAAVRGWHEGSKSGIFSNEVRDTRITPFIVKSFSGGRLVEGQYQAIRERIIAIGGHFTSNCYIAYKSGDGLSLGCIQLKGAALGAWMEFRKTHRRDLYKKAIHISGFKEGKKGKVVFRVPQFGMSDLTEETNAKALAIDQQLQEYLDGYFKRTTPDQAETRQPETDEAVQADSEEEPSDAKPTVEDDVPF